MKTAWIFQHVPFEGPGAIAPWLLSRGYDLNTFRWWEQTSPPCLDDVDLLIMMGGPMSVNDTEELPWLQEETHWLSAALKRELPMLGICLGAQLLASALGARVQPNAEREIGWWPVQPMETTGRDPVTVLHWHGETFELPEGAVHLEWSEACRHQSFRWGERAIGLQYHPEATQESLDALIVNSRHELQPGPFVQTEEEIRTGFKRYAPAALSMLDRVLATIVRV